jgi:hypothetical protein
MIAFRSGLRMSKQRGVISGRVGPTRLAAVVVENVWSAARLQEKFWDEIQPAQMYPALLENHSPALDEIRTSLS